ncbi:MAG TPA: hypothetical protein VFE05_16975 [Longimicrobiaceae bacterium]|nr:hypothetical protein [Longimicrobiaceae bacterium]
MKKLLLALALGLSTAASAHAQAANYAGAWTLDMARSHGLPPYYSQVKSHRLDITQDAAHLDVGVQVDILGHTDSLSFVYNLDGSETDTQTSIRMQNGPVPVPTKLKAAVTDGGMHITIARTIPMGDHPFTGVTTEDWSLSADGRTLTVHRVDDSPRGQMVADMVFSKD